MNSVNVARNEYNTNIKYLLPIIRRIRQYFNCNDSYPNADMTFHHIECIVNWVDNDISMTINGKDDDII